MARREGPWHLFSPLSVSFASSFQKIEISRQTDTRSSIGCLIFLPFSSLFLGFFSCLGFFSGEKGLCLQSKICPPLIKKPSKYAYQSIEELLCSSRYGSAWEAGLGDPLLKFRYIKEKLARYKAIAGTRRIYNTTALIHSLLGLSFHIPFALFYPSIILQNVPCFLWSFTSQTALKENFQWRSSREMMW